MAMADAMPMPAAAPMMMKRSAPMASGGGGAGVAGMADMAGGMDSLRQQSDTGSSDAPLFGQPVILKEAYVTGEVQRVDVGLRTITDMALAAQCTIESSNVNLVPDAEDDPNSMQWRAQSSASLRLRIPPASLEAFLTSLRTAFAGGAESPLASAGKPRLVSEHVSASDASSEYVDAATRERTEVAALNTMESLLAQATAVQDVLAVRREMHAITQRLESARAQRKVLEQRAAASTVHITLNSPAWRPPTPRPQPGWSVWASAARAVRSLAYAAQHAVDFLIFTAVFALPVAAGVAVLSLVLRALTPHLVQCIPVPVRVQWANVMSGGAGGAASGSAHAPAAGAGGAAGARDE